MTFELIKPFLCFCILGLFLSACSSIPTNNRLTVSESSIAYYHQGSQEGPTIVFQSGLGDGKNVWKKVIKELPESTPIFAYDRPGYGDSKTTNDERSPCNIAKEVHTLLELANIPPPYILVGHSLGGLYQYCFARLFPSDTAALVLLDPTHPEHWSRMKEEAPVQANMIKGLRATIFSKAMRQEFDDQENCLNIVKSNNPVVVPTYLLFSGKFKIEEQGAFKNMVKSLRRDWSNLFSLLEVIDVPGSGHYLQTESPDTVSSVIISVFHKVKIGK